MIPVLINYLPVFLDFQKAFDTANHDHDIGPNQLIVWFTSATHLNLKF